MKLEGDLKGVNVNVLELVSRLNRLEDFTEELAEATIELNRLFTELLESDEVFEEALGLGSGEDPGGDKQP